MFSGRSREGWALERWLERCRACAADKRSRAVALGVLRNLSFSHCWVFAILRAPQALLLSANTIEMMNFRDDEGQCGVLSHEH